MRQATDVKMQPAIIRGAFEGVGRAIAAFRETAELQFAILARQMPEWLLEFKADADDVGREPDQFGHTRRYRNRFRGRLGDHLEVRDHPRLAGVDHVAVLIETAEYLAVHKTHPAGPANAAAAVIGQLDATHQRAVEQEITAIHKERLVVEGYLANLCHYSTSIRMGRTCRVCAIWLWSNAATRMKTPVLIGTSNWLCVSSRRATSSDQCPDAHRPAHRTSARSPENSPDMMTPGTTVPTGI